MYDLFIDVPDLDILEKALFRSPKPGHKYISRKRKGGRWVYTYRKTRTSRHGHGHAWSEDEHSLDIHADSHKLAHSPDRAYQHSAWMGELNAFLAAPRRKVVKLKNISGRTMLTVRSTGKEANPYIVFEGKKKTYMKSTSHLVRWLQKIINRPFEVTDSSGMVHHTLTPAIAQASRAAVRREAWMTAKFNKDHPFDPYRGSKRDTRVFRDRQEYESWWSKMTQLMLGSRGKSKVKVGSKAMKIRPMTSLLESGRLPFRVEEYTDPKTKTRAFRWRIDFTGGRVPEKEFMPKFADEHLGMVIAITAKNLARFYPTDKKSRNELFNDAKAEAHVGLLEAAHRYDPAKGFKFTSYAYSYIERTVRRYLQGKLTAKIKTAKPKRTEEKTSAAVESAIERYSKPVNLDMETQHLLKEAWRRAQEKNFERTLEKVGPETPEGLAVFDNYLTFADTRTYDESQDWVAEHMDKPWVLPIDEPSSYIKTMEERKEILGDKAGKKLSKEEYAKSEKKWQGIVTKHFADKKKKSRSKSEGTYHTLVRDIFLKMLPNGADFSPKYSFLQLADMFRRDLERQFGNPKKPILTAIQRQDQIKHMFESELPELAASPSVLKFQKESPLRKGLQDDLVKSLLSLWVDMAREYTISKAFDFFPRGDTLPYHWKAAQPWDKTDREIFSKQVGHLSRAMKHDPEHVQGWAHDLRDLVKSGKMYHGSIGQLRPAVTSTAGYGEVGHPSENHLWVGKAIREHKYDARIVRAHKPVLHEYIKHLARATYKDDKPIYRGTALSSEHLGKLAAGATFHAGTVVPWSLSHAVAKQYSLNHRTAKENLESARAGKIHSVVFHVHHPKYGTDISNLAGFQGEQEVASGGNYRVINTPKMPTPKETPLGTVTGPVHIHLEHLPHDAKRPKLSIIRKSDGYDWIDQEVEDALKEQFQHHHRLPANPEVEQKIVKALTSMWVDHAREHVIEDLEKGIFSYKQHDPAESQRRMDKLTSMIHSKEIPDGGHIGVRGLLDHVYEDGAHFNLAQAVQLHKHNSHRVRNDNSKAYAFIKALASAPYQSHYPETIWRGLSVPNRMLDKLTPGATFRGGRARPWTSDSSLASEYAQSRVLANNTAGFRSGPSGFSGGFEYNPTVGQNHPDYHQAVVFHVHQPKYGTDITHLGAYQSEQEVVSGGKYRVSHLQSDPHQGIPTHVRDIPVRHVHLEHLPHDVSRPRMRIEKSHSHWVDPEVEQYLLDEFHNHHRHEGGEENE